MSAEDTKYLARIVAGRAELAIIGRASYLNCVNLGKFLEKVSTDCRGEIIIDCGSCEGMDSTVLGILAGTALKMRKRGGKVLLTNLGARNMELVENLGLNKILDASQEGEKLPICIEDALPDGTPARPVEILKAHESLIEADAGNAEKFRDVVKFLKEEGIAESED